MLFRFTPQRRLTARTVSDQFLGRVVGAEVDAETGRIATFLVSGRSMLQLLANDTLVIKWNQVVRWDDHDIVVDDAVVREPSAAIAFSASPAVPTSVHPFTDAP